MLPTRRMKGGHQLGEVGFHHVDEDPLVHVQGRFLDLAHVGQDQVLHIGQDALLEVLEGLAVLLDQGFQGLVDFLQLPALSLKFLFPPGEQGVGFLLAGKVRVHAEEPHDFALGVVDGVGPQEHGELTALLVPHPHLAGVGAPGHDDLEHIPALLGVGVEGFGNVQIPDLPGVVSEKPGEGRVLVEMASLDVADADGLARGFHGLGDVVQLGLGGGLGFASGNCGVLLLFLGRHETHLVKGCAGNEVEIQYGTYLCHDPPHFATQLKYRGYASRDS